MNEIPNHNMPTTTLSLSNHKCLHVENVVLKVPVCPSICLHTYVVALRDRLRYLERPRAAPARGAPAAVLLYID